MMKCIIDQKGLKMFGTADEVQLVNLSDILQSVCTVKKNYSNICCAGD